MHFNEIEGEFFEYTDKESSRFAEILQILDNMLKDKKLGNVADRKEGKAQIIVKAESFQRTFLLLENRVGLHGMTGIVNFKLIRDGDNKPMRREIKGKFDEAGNFIQN